MKNIFNGMLGNATEITLQAAREQLSKTLYDGEIVKLAYKLVRDMIVLTDTRLIIVDKQGITGKKTEYKTIPYKSISRFSVETAGNFDFDSELKIYISSEVEPTISLNFGNDKSIEDIQKALAMAIL